MNHEIMIDLETLGLDDDAVIVQVAAVSFDQEYRIHGTETFDEYISVSDSLLNGFTTTKSTLEFWAKELKKNKWLRDEVGRIFNSPNTVGFVAHNLDYYFRQNIKPDTTVWANGLLFDIPKVDNLLRVAGFPQLQDRMSYQNARDLRSIRKEASVVNPAAFNAGSAILNTKYNNSAHNAYYDCLYQIEMLELCRTIMKMR